MCLSKKNRNCSYSFRVSNDVSDLNSLSQNLAKNQLENYFPNCSMIQFSFSCLVKSFHLPLLYYLTLFVGNCLYLFRVSNDGSHLKSLCQNLGKNYLEIFFRNCSMIGFSLSYSVKSYHLPLLYYSTFFKGNPALLPCGV